MQGRKEEWDIRKGKREGRGERWKRR